MKMIIILTLLISVGIANADVLNPLPNLRVGLEQTLHSTQGRKTINEMKAIANERNTDIGVAFEDYLIAKKNVSIARAQLNPITTGHLLGMSLGLSYLWAPIAIEAILSIPTKIYNISKNKYLTKVANYNLNEAQGAIGNELAHLYYDILTHEVILKTIDQEIQVLTYREARWTERNFPADRLADVKKRILNLGKEHVDFYNLYVSELAAIRTLISTTDGTNYELAQVPLLLNKLFLSNLNEEKLQDFSLRVSNKYKASINLVNASVANVKQVQWSILSWSGLNLGYRSRVKDAKNESEIAQLRKESTGLEVKTNVLLQLEKFDSSLNILTNYNTISENSLDFFSNISTSSQFGQISEDDVVEAAINAIGDFRNKVVAHYSAWSSFDDFSNSANYNFQVGSDNQTAQEQIQNNPLYKFDEEIFKVVRNDTLNTSTLFLSSPDIGLVARVDYIFDTNALYNKSSDNGEKNYSVTIFKNEKTPAVYSGTALVKLDNGYEFNIKFNL